MKLAGRVDILRYSRRMPFSMDDLLFDSPQLLTIPKRLRAAAVGVYTLCAVWADQHQTMGLVPEDVIRKSGGAPALKTWLIKSNLWDAEGCDAIRIATPRTSRIMLDASLARETGERLSPAERSRRYRAKRKQELSVTKIVTTASPPSRDASPAASPNVTQDSCRKAPDQQEPSSAASPAAVSPEKTNHQSNQPTKVTYPSIFNLLTKSGNQSSSSLGKSSPKPGTVLATTEKKTAHGTRLPDGWVPEPQLIVELGNRYPQVSLRDEFEKFSDYWLSMPGQRGRKVDWNRTFRNWIREAADRMHRRSPTQMATGDLRVLQGEDLKAKFRAKENPTLEMESGH